MMNPGLRDGECAREEELLEVLATGQWPARCEPELTAHVGGCESCRDLIAVATALVNDHESATRHARVPPAAVVWWRAQAAGREEAARAAARPIAFAQGAAAAGAVWLTVSLLRMSDLTAVLAWREWLARLAGAMPDVPAAAAAIPGGVVFLAVVGGAVVLAPVALLVVVRSVLREE